MDQLIGLAETSLSACEARLRSLPRWKLDYIRKASGQVIEEVFKPHKHRRALYGNLTRVLDRRQLIAFFEELYRFRNKAVYDDFCLMFFYALRVGELDHIEVLPGQKIVKVENHKCRRVEYLPLIPGTEPLFERLRQRSRHSPFYLGKYFRETCDRLGDEYLYRYHGVRRQFTTHCLRKTAGNMLRELTGDPYKEAVYLRHNTQVLFGVTAHYMHYGLEQMRADLTASFGDLVDALVIK